MKKEDRNFAGKLLYDMYAEMNEDLDFELGSYESFFEKYLEMCAYGHHYVFKKHGAVIGYCLLSEVEFKSKIIFDTNKMCYLSILVVDKQHRNQGAGSKLLEHAKKECLKLGYSELNIEVLSFSEENQKFYKNNDFVEMTKHMICFFDEE